MNFDFSDDQKELRNQSQKFLTDKCPTTVPRAILEGDKSYDEDLWRAIAEMGYTATVIPEEYGGIGYGYLELCVIAEEMGRALAPVPFSSSVYLATEAIMLAGDEDQKQKYLPKLAAGELIGTFAVSEGPGVATAENLGTSIEGGKLSGEKSPVPDGDIADFAIVAARGGSGGDSVTLAIVDLTGEGVTRSTVETIDPTRSHGRVVFKDAPAETLGAEGEGWAIKDRLFDRAAVLFALEQLGGADACLGMAQEYARNRYAFGRPIGSFQAIKHKLADMFIKNELARSNAYYGAWALSTDADELPIAAAGARIAASDAYSFGAKENIQTHGGNGFTWEYDCHLYYRRARLLALTLGSPRVWKDRLITQIEASRVAREEVAV